MVLEPGRPARLLPARLCDLEAIEPGAISIMTRICVVTGSRADYGHLSWLMKRIQASPTLELQLVATGMHLQESQGSTIGLILADGFEIDRTVSALSEDDSPSGILASMAKAMTGMSAALLELRPEVVLLLGDRFEVFSAALAAYIHRIPIVHVHGGEVTGGAIDEGIRHSITKMAHLHFVSTEVYRHRVIQLGEEASHVYNFGALAVEAVRHTPLVSLEELESDLGINLDRFLLVTYHPVTLKAEGSAGDLDAMLDSLDAFPDHTIVITRSNSDTGATDLHRRVEDYAAVQPGRVALVAALGQRRYLSLLARADAAVGNSSSSFVEAPVLAVPAVDIGDRQHGRLRSPNILHADPEGTSIARAIDEALSPAFRARIATAGHPFGDGQTSRRIVEVLERTDFGALGPKAFIDI